MRHRRDDGAAAANRSIDGRGDQDAAPLARGVSYGDTPGTTHEASVVTTAPPTLDTAGRRSSEKWACRTHYETAAGGAYESAVFYAPGSEHARRLADECLARIEQCRTDGDERWEAEEKAPCGARKKQRTHSEGWRGRASKGRLRLVDFGGGTGAFTARLARLAGIVSDSAGAETIENPTEDPDASMALVVEPCQVGRASHQSLLRSFVVVFSGASRMAGRCVS